MKVDCQLLSKTILDFLELQNLLQKYVLQTITAQMMALIIIYVPTEPIHLLQAE